MRCNDVQLGCEVAAAVFCITEVGNAIWRSSKWQCFWPRFVAALRLLQGWSRYRKESPIRCSARHFVVLDQCSSHAYGFTRPAMTCNSLDTTSVVCCNRMRLALATHCEILLRLQTCTATVAASINTMKVC